MGWILTLTDSFDAVGSELSDCAHFIYFIILNSNLKQVIFNQQQY